MNFELQRFDTESGPKWIRDGVSHPRSTGTYANAWCFIPAGKTYTNTSTSYYDDAYEITMHYFTFSPDGNETIRIAKADGSKIKWGFGDDGIEGQTTTAVTYTGSVPASDILVTGSDRSLLRITIDGVEYTVGENGHLVAVPTAVVLGSIKVYHNGTAYDVASIYDTKQTELNLTIWHDDAEGYISLTTEKPSAPCLAIRHNGANYYAMK